MYDLSLQLHQILQANAGVLRGLARARRLLVVIFRIIGKVDVSILLGIRETLLQL